MRVLVSPDSYKGSLSANRVAEAMADGIRQAIPDAEVDLLPIADGGEGTVDCLLRAAGGEKVPVVVHNPLGQRTESYYGVLPDKTVVIEVAAAIGPHLIPAENRDVLHSHTRGVGELIARALDHGHTSFIVGLGGSATNDAGLGMLTALGARLYDASGGELEPTPYACRSLAKVDLSQMHPQLKHATFRIACDVRNPLCGPNGATAVYGPQKGVLPEWLPMLDGVLSNFADIVQRNCGMSIKDIPGAGAAGGLGGALTGILGGEIVPGVDLVMDVARYDDRLQKVDLVLTGEGRTDGQTLSGKVVMGVALRAKAAGVPVVCLSGAVAEDVVDALYDLGIDAALTIVPGPVTLEDAMENTAMFLTQSTKAALRLFRAGANTDRKGLRV